MTKYQNNNIGFLRFIFSCLVVIGHAYTLNIIQIEKLFLEDFFKSLTALSVSSFFIVSGFLIQKSIYNTPKYNVYIKKRLFRIIPLYYLTILISTIALSLVATIPLESYWTQASTWKYLGKNLIFNISHHINGVFENNKYQSPNGSIWSIPYELLCYFLFSIAFLFKYKSSKVFEKALIILYILLQITFITVYTLEDTNTELRFVVNLSKYISLFYSGYLISYFNIHKKFTIYWGGAISLFLFMLTYNLTSAKTVFVVPFSYIFWSIFIIYISTRATSNLPKFSKYGDPSYGIYLMSFPIQQIFIQYFPNWHPLFNALSTLILVVPLSYITWHYFEKPIINYVKEKSLSK
jgi:peptidoglycan/LPS O-acetylase OafA/YrhL